MEEEVKCLLKPKEWNLESETMALGLVSSPVEMEKNKARNELGKLFQTRQVASESSTSKGKTRAEQVNAEQPQRMLRLLRSWLNCD